MLKLFLDLWQHYGFSAVQLAVICWFGWKFMTNHWVHFTDKIEDIHKDVKSNRRAIDRMGNRVSRLEGKLDK